MKNWKDERYNNRPVYHSTGKLMFMANAKRVQWYLKKGLAEERPDGGITLTFETGGMGEPEELLGKDRNECVVCKSPDKLTAHHIVPYLYMQYMPAVIKDKNRYNVVTVCRTCHDTYEKIANSTMRLSLVSDQVNLLMQSFRAAWAKYSSASRLFEKIHEGSAVVPEDRIIEMAFYEKMYSVRCVEISVQICRLTGVKYVPETKPQTLMEKIVKVTCLRLGYNSLAKMWSTHFVETMKPMNMPDWWDAVYDRDDIEEYLGHRKTVNKVENK